MGWYNDNNHAIDKNGMMTTGFGGASDGAANPTYPYAKNDVHRPVSAIDIVSDGATIAVTYLTGDIPQRTIPASRTAKCAVPFPGQFFRTTATVSPSGGANPATAPKGVLVKSLALFYRVNTTDITSITMAINSMTMAAAAALPTVTALTVTLAGGTLVQAANVYALVATVTTPAWVTAQDAMYWGVATIVTPGSSTVDILGASWRLAESFY